MKIKDRVKPKTPPVKPGVYLAVCVGVIDLGEQYSELYKNFSNKIKFIWALPTETMEVDGKQEERQLSREFSVATKKTSKLRTFLNNWNGITYGDEDFLELDLFSQIGKPCQLNVVLSENGEYANVESAIPLPNGMPAVDSNTPYIMWDMDRWDDTVFASLPEWVQEQIKKSTQYKNNHPSTETIAVKPAEAPASHTGGAPF